ncbi:MAG: GNAT family protein [bacterium]
MTTAGPDPRLVFYEGKHVILKVLTEDDVLHSDWVGWFNDAELCRFNQHHYYPNTMERQREYLRTAITPTKIQLGILDKQSPDCLCGFVSLQDIDLLHRRAEIAGFQDQRVTGSRPFLFWESWSIMIRHAFETLNLHKVYGGTFHPDGAAALKRMLNFEVEGVQRHHIFKNGQYVDVVLLAVFHDTFKYPEF